MTAPEVRVVLMSPDGTAFAVDRNTSSCYREDVPHWETYRAAPVAWLTDADVADWTPLVAERDCDRQPGDVVLRDGQCCQLACVAGACESCPCCCAGWCVNGFDGLPDGDEERSSWLEVAAKHNPIAAALLVSLPPAPGGADGVEWDDAEAGAR